MNIRGIYKTSLIDFPGRICTVLFSGGCNLRCRFCHNPDLACNRKHLELSTNEEALAFLKKRKNLIDGVTLSGGEPTLASNIEAFIQEVKNLDLQVKLDTNGFRPDVITGLAENNMLDYVAIDVKTSPQKYNDLAGCEVDFQKIVESIKILRNNDVNFEIRTTCIPGYATIDDMMSIRDSIGYVDRYYLQQFISDTPLLDDAMQIIQPYPVKVLKELRDFVLTFADTCEIRGE